VLEPRGPRGGTRRQPQHNVRASVLENRYVCESEICVVLDPGPDRNFAEGGLMPACAFSLVTASTPLHLRSIFLCLSFSSPHSLSIFIFLSCSRSIYVYSSRAPVWTSTASLLPSLSLIVFSLSRSMTHGDGDGSPTLACLVLIPPPFVSPFKVLFYLF
jgi:hypothetical protein